MVVGSLRGLLILNTIVLGFMLLYIVIFLVINNPPAEINAIIFVSILLINIGILLYRSGSSLSEYEKYFKGLGSGISGCVLSALGLGIMPFLVLSQTDAYVYAGMLGYSLLIGILYILLNEIHGKYRKEKVNNKA